jgi:uncharacterized protein (DUF1501 family)
MKRRTFIKNTIPAVAAPFVLGNLSLSAIGENDLPIDPCDLATDRCIVLIRLGGGTDGINLVVPIEQYDNYANLRPTIKHSLNSIIQLDNTLDIANQVGLHPGMQKFKNLYDQGKFHIVQGVSYPNANRSHFRSTKIMQAGLQGNSNLASTTGWAARYLKHGYNPESFLDPLGISIENEAVFENNFDARYHMSVKPGGIENMFNFAETLPDNFEDLTNVSDYHKSLSHIVNTNAGIEEYAERIYSVYNAGSNAINVNYPSNNKLAAGLKMVAKLISGGSTTKVFSLSMGGWDTHNNQINRQNNLVNTLTEAIGAFMDDLTAQNLDHRVIGTTYSEFGRTVAQNANGGTDHGAIFPMFLFGGGVDSGITGTNVDLSNIAGNILHNPQHDYRDILTTLMQDWLGTDSDSITQAGFGEFLDDKIPSIDEDQVIDSSCYTVVEPDTQQRLAQNPLFDENQSDHLNIYPNPSFGEFNVDFYSSMEEIGILKILNQSGKEMYRENINIFEEENTFSFNLNLPNGLYAVLIQTENGIIGGDYLIIK